MLSSSGMANFDLELIETELRKALDHHLVKADGKAPPHLAESIRYSLLSPGKRIRPRIVLACAEMLGLPTAQVIPAALALEMTHCFTLIHDDLPCMDNDDYRRGMLSNHKKFGESLALLAGDALMALAMDVFLTSPVEAPLSMAGLKHLVWAMGPRGVIGGQAAESLLNQNSRFEELRQMHRQKTGALFSAALLIPKEFAGISDQSAEGQIIYHFADQLGLGFQVADDLEDGNKSPTPTSVLFYLSPQEACQLTVKALQKVNSELSQVWGSKAQLLLSISEEVIRKTEKAFHEGFQ